MESAGRQPCPNHLRQIGLGLLMYANENRGAFPRTVYDGAGGPPTAYTGAIAPNPFGPGGPAPNDVTAALFLVLRTQDLDPGTFICPSAPLARPWDYSGRSKTQVSNFPGRAYLSYAFQNPYPTKEAVKAGFRLSSYDPKSDVAIAADMGPGGSTLLTTLPNATRQEMAVVNSPNHEGDGQDVLFADGHVEFIDSPYGGSSQRGSDLPRDNIYTSGLSSSQFAGEKIHASPVDAFDSVLLPTMEDGPPEPPLPLARRLSTEVRIFFAQIVGVVLLLFLLLLKKRRRAFKATPSR